MRSRRTRDALRIRAERAESDLDAARTENQHLAERLTQAPDTEAADPGPTDTQARPRTASHTPQRCLPHLSKKRAARFAE